MCLISEHSAAYLALSDVLAFLLESTEPGEIAAVGLHDSYDPCRKPSDFRLLRSAEGHGRQK